MLNPLAKQILGMLNDGAKGPAEAIGIIDEVICMIALFNGDDEYPKESESIMTFAEGSYKIQTKVIKMVN